MASNRYSNIGKGGIVKEGIFERFPDLIPAISNNWGNSSNHCKLMIVGESNYFDDNTDSVFKDPEAWYKGVDTQHLIPDNKKTDVNNWKSDYPPFDKLCKSMNEVSNQIHCKAIYDEAMYYNYFLRPATGSKSFKDVCTKMDREVAGVALCGILEIDKPDMVIFASKFAYDEFTNYSKVSGYTTNILIDFVYHPSSKFQKWDSNPNSKQKFERLLKEHWVLNK